MASLACINRWSLSSLHQAPRPCPTTHIGHPACRRRQPTCSVAQHQPNEQFHRSVSCAGSKINYGVEELVLQDHTPQSLEQDKQWLAVQVSTWLNEEWTPLDIHTQLGEAAGEAYVQARLQGESEMGGLLLSVTSQLMTFNYFDTFTSAFEVGNKVVELVMLREDCEVCCTSQDDKDRVVRVDQELTAMMQAKE